MKRGSALPSFVLFLLLLCLSRVPARAASGDVPSERRSFHTLQKDGEIHHFELVRSRNPVGSWELAVIHDEIRRGLPNTTHEVLWARDADGDGLMDAWFTLDRSGQLEVMDRPAWSDDSWDVAREILAEQVRLKNRWALGILFNSVTRNLTLVRSHEFTLRQDLFRAQMDLLDLQVRADRLRARIRAGLATPGAAEEFQTIQGVISDGWREICETISKEGYRRHFVMAVGDVGLYLTGAAVLRGVGAGFRWLGAKFSGRAAEQSAGELYAKQVARAGERAAEALRRSGGANAGVVQALRLSAREKAGLVLRALESRGRMGQWMADAMRTSGRVLGASARQAPYVAVSQTTQLMAEVWNRRDVIFDPNPIVLARNIASDRDLIQNLVFMTNETFLMAGVSTYYRGLGKRMRICGAIALVNSNASSILVKHETDPLRMALDSGFEAIVGNSQVQLDMAAMEYFSRLAKENGNPKLRLVAYAIAFADGLAGYVAYGKLTQAYEKSKKAGGGEPADVPRPPALVMVPVYAPEG